MGGDRITFEVRRAVAPQLFEGHGPAQVEVLEELGDELGQQLDELSEFSIKLEKQ
jgi:hypothetical protein